LPASKQKIIACIQAYNAEEKIAKLILLTGEYADKVVVYDSGSNDMTFNISEGLGVEVIRDKIHLGDNVSLAKLFEKAREENATALVTLDGDGKHDPKDIPVLLEPIMKGEADIVVGSSLQDFGKSKILMGKKVETEAAAKSSNGIIYVDLTNPPSSFRAYNRKAIRLLKPEELETDVGINILIKAKEAGLTLKEIPRVMPYKKEPPKVLTQVPTSHETKGVLSTLKHLPIRYPMILYGLPGLLSLIISVIFWFWMLDSYMKTGTFTTNMALMAVVTIVVGLVLMMAGTILWTIATLIREKEIEITSKEFKQKG